MYASSNGPTGEGIFSALSTDGGLRFVREPGIRLARETKWERFGLFSPEPLIIGDGSAVRMFYAGVPNKDAGFILSALSKNGGVNFVKDRDPALQPGGKWDKIVQKGAL